MAILKSEMAEMEAEVLAAVERLGPTGFDRTPIVQKWVARGHAASSVYRNIAKILATGRPLAHLARAVKEAAPPRSAASPAAPHQVDADPPPAERADAAVVVEAPTLPEFTGAPIAHTIRELQSCADLAKAIMASCRSEDGKIRNPRLALAASEHLRRAIETAVRLAEAAADLRQVEQFHRAVFAVLEGEDPALAQRVVTRLGIVVDHFAP